MVTQFKCPSCGNDLSFDASTGKLQCPSCGHSMPIEETPKTEVYNQSPADPSDVTMFDPNDIPEECSYQYVGEASIPHTEFSDTDVNEYQCNNCGAIILAGKDTTATLCSFCGSPVVLTDRLSGKLAPAKVIPFRITREDAQARFKKWCKNGRFTPNSFRQADRVKNITGIYVPFWLFDMNGNGDVDATCTRVRSYTRGQYRTTETSYFHVYRKFNVHYIKVPVDASEKMNDDLMDKLEPYSYSDLKTFELPYLSGFLAEKYNYTDSDLYPRIHDRITAYINDYIQSTLTGYTTTRINRKDVHIKPINAFYTLLPVWMVCYDYKDSEHIFAMNGQTGKIVGKPPLDKGKIAKWFALLSAASFAVAKVVGFFIGGTLL